MVQSDRTSNTRQCFTDVTAFAFLAFMVAEVDELVAELLASPTALALWAAKRGISSARAQAQLLAVSDPIWAPELHVPPPSAPTGLAPLLQRSSHVTQPRAEPQERGEGELGAGAAAGALQSGAVPGKAGRSGKDAYAFDLDD